MVLVTQRISRDGLYRDLIAARERLAEAGIVAVHRAGDCIVPGIVADAVFSGHRLAREIDTANPDQHQPFERERLVLPVRAPLRIGSAV